MLPRSSELKNGEKKGIDPALKEAAEDAIDLLVNSDRVLSITIMLDASSTTADDPKDQKKVDKENDKAAEDFANGDQERDQGNFDDAVQQYRKAWKHAQHALKAADG